MKNLTKQRLKERFEKTKIDSHASVKNVKVKIYGKIYDKKLTIVIPGEPIQDGRVKFTTNADMSGHTYNINKNNMMKIFDIIYKENPILENVCIMSPMVVKVEIFRSIPSKYMKSIKKCETDMELLKRESLVAPRYPDNDNYEKVHWDVLGDSKYLIILRDETIIMNETVKVFVEDPAYARSVVTIYYTEDMEDWYRDIVENSAMYLRYLISKKYFSKNKIDKKDWSKTFFKNIASFVISKPTVQIDKSILSILKKHYTIEELKIIAGGKGNNKDHYIKNILNTSLKLREEVLKKMKDTKKLKKGKTKK